MSTVLKRSSTFEVPSVRDPVAYLRDQLGPQFAARSAEHDEHDRFVAINFSELRENGYFTAAIPRELGGWGHEPIEVAELLRELGRHCSSTALAFAMHTHQVAIAAWRHRHLRAPTADFLRSVAERGTALLSTGGGDWLDSSGSAVAVPGGYEITAVKPFVSGASFGDLLNTSAVLVGSDGTREVLHFAVPMNSAGISIEPTWRALGMRATGSETVRLDSVRISDAAVSLRRPAGRWHPALHLVSMIAIPLIYSVYLGIAESARERVVLRVRRSVSPARSIDAIGGLDTELHEARLAHGELLRAMASNTPGVDTTNRVMMSRVIIARSVRRVLDLALDAGGGNAFYREATIERLFRDVQASRYHPLQEPAQRDLAGRLALGLLD